MARQEPMAGQRRGYVWLLAGVAALGGLLFGYDTAVISGAIGFLRDHFALSPEQKGWAAASALLGCAIGAALAGTLSDRFGRRSVLVISALLFLISAVGTALPWTFTQFVVFRIIGGLGVGAASMTSPMYIAEVSPARIRGQMVSVNQLAIVSGMVVVYFVNFAIERYGASVDAPTVGKTIADAGAAVAADPSWNVARGWRWMFGSEAVPALALLLLLVLVPESPRFLVAKGREQEAARVLERIGGPGYARDELNEIRAALSHEPARVGQLFAPGMRLALVIGVVLAILQQVTGINVFLYFAPEIFKHIEPPAMFAGLGSETGAALLQTVIVGGVNLAFTVVAIYTVDRIGRKPLMIVGNIGMGVCLVGLSYFALDQEAAIDMLVSVLGGTVSPENAALGMLVFILGYIACFALSVGPVTWVILSELFPTKIRGRAMGIATVCLWVANFVVTQTFAMMDESPWLIARFGHALPFWIYTVFCVVSVVFIASLVPETKGRSLEEIERHWLDG